jgi:hypothetical protein
LARPEAAAFRYEQVVDAGGADQITSNPGVDQTIFFTADRDMPRGLRIAQPKVASGPTPLFQGSQCRRYTSRAPCGRADEGE